MWPFPTPNSTLTRSVHVSKNPSMGMPREQVSRGCRYPWDVGIPGMRVPQGRG